MSPSGYPLTVREWKRGQPREAREIWRGEATDAVAAGMHWDKVTATRFGIARRRFTTRCTSPRTPRGRWSRWTSPPISPSAPRRPRRGALRASGRSPARIWCSRLDPWWRIRVFVSGGVADDFMTLYFPRTSGARTAEARDEGLPGAVRAGEHGDEGVRVAFRRGRGGGRAQVHAGGTRSEELPSFSAGGVDSNFSNDLFVTTDGFLDPVTLSTATAPDIEITTPLKCNTAWFDAEGMSVTLLRGDERRHQDSLFSRQGRRRRSRGRARAHRALRLRRLRDSHAPGHSATVGESFLSRGMCYAMACIRGGASSAPRAPRRREALARVRGFRRRRQAPRRHGGHRPGEARVHGRQQRRAPRRRDDDALPELFGAVVSQCPLPGVERTSCHVRAQLDRRVRRPCGARGARRAVGFSPYHNIERGWNARRASEGCPRRRRRRAARPATLFTTSIKDDRAHPSHARRMVHKMRALGLGAGTLYHEMIEGGHAGAADNVARAKVKTIENARRRPVSGQSNPARSLSGDPSGGTNQDRGGRFVATSNGSYPCR